jgi:hypothetical protein
MQILKIVLILSTETGLQDFRDEHDLNHANSENRVNPVEGDRITGFRDEHDLNHINPENRVNPVDGFER